MSHYVVMLEDSLFRSDEIMINLQETLKEFVKFVDRYGCVYKYVDAYKLICANECS